MARDHALKHGNGFGGRSLHRSPLLIIITAILLCNFLAFSFFFHWDSALPRSSTSSSLRAQLNGVQDRKLAVSIPTAAPGSPASPAFAPSAKEDSNVQGKEGAFEHLNAAAQHVSPGKISVEQTGYERSNAAGHAGALADNAAATIDVPSGTGDVRQQNDDSNEDDNESNDDSNDDNGQAAGDEEEDDASQPAKNHALHADISSVISTVKSAIQHAETTRGAGQTELRSSFLHPLCNGRPCTDVDLREYPFPELAKNQTDWPIWWFAPFFDRTSFGKEAATLVLGMIRSGAVKEGDVWIGTSQGQCEYPVDTSMPRVDFDQLEEAKHRVDNRTSAIIMCHSLPPFWARPKNKWETCAPCPPVGYKPAVAIGRAMAETDVYHPEFVKYCNRMDEIWVPSDFSYNVLLESGVHESKLRIVPIAVNTTFYDPEVVRPVKLPVGDLVFGRHRRPLPPPPATEAHTGPPPKFVYKTAFSKLQENLEHAKQVASKRVADSMQESVDQGLSASGDPLSTSTGLQDGVLTKGESLIGALGQAADPATFSTGQDDAGRQFLLVQQQQQQQRQVLEVVGSSDGTASLEHDGKEGAQHGYGRELKSRTSQGFGVADTGLTSSQQGVQQLGPVAASGVQRQGQGQGPAKSDAASHGWERLSSIEPHQSVSADAWLQASVDAAATTAAGTLAGGTGLTLLGYGQSRVGRSLLGVTADVDGAAGNVHEVRVNAADVVGEGVVNTASPVAVGDARRSRKPFTFVSTFKWEMRKGWDIMLNAYLQEFTDKDDVELYILTKPFVTGNNFSGDMHDWAAKKLNVSGDQLNTLPTLYVISTHLTNLQYAGLYKAADAFVIPTRGEGWGMPITEAMSMGLPVIVTNWSGTTAFVDNSVGYMINYTLSRVPDDQPWWFRRALWADASVSHLRQILRHVFSNRKEAAHKGRLARERMVSKYSPSALGAVLAKEFDRLKALLRSGTCDRCHTAKWVAKPGDTATDYYTGHEPFLEDPADITKGASGGANFNLGLSNGDMQAHKASVWRHIIATVGKVGSATAPAAAAELQEENGVELETEDDSPSNEGDDDHDEGDDANDDDTDNKPKATSSQR